jgi:hypothetical protein
VRPPYDGGRGAGGSIDLTAGLAYHAAMARLRRCPSCKTHVLAEEASCPFCKVRFPVKAFLMATVGVVTFVSGIGCAYGGPGPYSEPDAGSGGTDAGAGGTGTNGGASDAGAG